MILRSQRLENANSKLLDLDDKTKLVMGGTDSCKGNMNFFFFIFWIHIEFKFVPLFY